MQLAPDVEWKQIYWTAGTSPKDTRFRNDVTDPPTGGWSHAFLVSNDGKSSVLILDPYHLAAFWVRPDSAEMVSAKEPVEGDGSAYDLTPERRRRIVGRIRETWDYRQQMGLPCNFDEAAIVLRKLGEEVPTIMLTSAGEEDTKSRGGKPTAAALLKPVRPDGKRGRFLQWFLDADDRRRSVREAMAEFDMSRSNVLSYLFTINKDHGIGYNLIGDAVTVELPAECEDPFG